MFSGGVGHPGFELMQAAMMQAFFHELEKISAASTARTAFGGLPGANAAIATQVAPPAKPAEVKPPIKPVDIKAKVIGPKRGLTTNYTKPNVEAPQTDIGITAAQKVVAPPSATS